MGSEPNLTGTAGTRPDSSARSDDFGGVPAVDFTAFGHYQVGDWAYAYAVVGAGETGEQRCGRLFHRGAQLCGPVASQLMTPWGPMTYYDDESHTGWLLAPISLTS